MTAGRRAVAVRLLALALLATACSSTGGETATDPADQAEGTASSTAADGGDSTDGASGGDGGATDDGDESVEPAVEPLEPLTEAELAEIRVEVDAAVARYVDTRSVDSAREVVQVMGQSRDIGYAPWLLDLTQTGISNRLTRDAIDVLGAMTGFEPTGVTFSDFGQIGSIVESQAIEPAPGYRDWKLALFERLDPAFRPLLASVTDDDRFNRIRFGGARRGGIPELNDPPRITAEEAGEWITDDEIVLGVAIDGEVVAYPFRIVGHHELVNDTVGGRPVSVVYCTLCRTGLLFDREVEGQVLDFETSGLLINSNKIMVDRQTDTLWHHAAGLGIGGELEGVTLDILPMETTTWAEWVASHPDTEVLEIPGPIFFEDPERPPIVYPYEPDSPYTAYYDDPTTWFPIRDVSDAFAAKDEVLGIRHAGGVLAVSVADVVSGPSRYFAVGDGAVVVVPNSRGARVYAVDEASLDALSGLDQGSTVTAAVADTDGAVLTDGSTLTRLAVEQGFWFSWFDLHPDTARWPE
ncbi:MAG: DUF3179 domain-containing (seleno)protein [Actinomycetota bacterium]